jgi:hypothetical protein
MERTHPKAAERLRAGSKSKLCKANRQIVWDDRLGIVYARIFCNEKTIANQWPDFQSEILIFARTSFVAAPLR